MAVLLHWLALIKNNPLVWAQAVHALIGYGVLLTVYREGLRKRYWFVGVLVFLGAFGIEVWYDPTYEHDPFFWGGIRDLLFYFLGAVTGVIVDYGWVSWRLKCIGQRLPR